MYNLIVFIHVATPSGNTLRRGTIGRRSAKNTYMNTTIMEPPSPTHVRHTTTHIFHSIVSGCICYVCICTM